MVIKVMTSDGVVWNKDKFIIDLISAGRQKIIIDLCYEGPDCEFVGLDDIIATLDSYKWIDASLVEIKTSNQLTSSRYQEVRQLIAELPLAQKLARDVVPTYTIPELKFGMFISRSNWLRLGLASYVWKYYKHSTCMTFHYDSSNDYHRKNLGLEEFISRHWADREQVFDFVSTLPIKFDNQTYPILYSGQAFNLQQHYPKFFCEIICETFFTNRTFMITEKTLRPILNRKPFIVQGPKWYLKNLQLLGFKTFDQWWNESYDQDPCDSRYTGLQYNIDYIAQQSSETINRWCQEMQPTLEHNYQTLLNLTNNQIRSTDFYYE